MKSVFRKYSFLSFILLFLLNACKKDELITPGEIQGPASICFGAQEVEYQITLSNPVDYVLWTVPEGSEIISGQGTTKIIVNFGDKEGDVTAQPQFDNNSGPIKKKSIIFSCQASDCRIKNFPGQGREAGLSFVVGDKGYIFGGYGGTFPNTNYLDDLWEYDKNTGTWSQKSSLSSLMSNVFVYSYSNSFVINQKFYFITDFSVQNDSTWYFVCYDPLSNTWAQKSIFPGTEKIGSACFSVSGKGYVCCGSKSFNSTDSIQTTSKVYEYDPVNDSWTTKNPFPGKSRIYSSGFSFNGQGYLLGGYESTYSNNTYANNYWKDFWKYNPQADSWIQLQDLNTETYRSNVISNGTNIYLYGGYTPNFYNYLKEFLAFDPQTETWSFFKTMKGKSTGSITSFIIGNSVYYGLGSYYESGLTKNSNELFNFCLE
jgi:N-acetylneuraminic acid mutarotase